MASEKRLIDAEELWRKFESEPWYDNADRDEIALPMVDDAPTVDAVEAEEMREFAQDVAYQFGYYCQNGGRLHITHGGLSTLEWAFDILGWENPHPVPECECEIDGCHEHATCGASTKDGYKRMCGRHCREREMK
jgi:hypothetical protein